MLISKRVFQANLVAVAVLSGAAASAFANENTAASSIAAKTTQVGDDERVHCVDPTACCEESKKVIDVVNKLVAAYATGDISTYEHYLDDKCTLFDESNKEMTVGKEAVLAHLKSSFAEHSPGGPNPLISLTIDQPYAKVHGDRCVVNFVATLKTGGEHPHTERAKVMDVFVKRGGEWRKSYWQGKWEPIADEHQS
jgi:hypothetical protein